jgi:hypothetical protein
VCSSSNSQAIHTSIYFERLSLHPVGGFVI